jgi:uncharacterized coiled-coil protein SlyX
MPSLNISALHLNINLIKGNQIMNLIKDIVYDMQHRVGELENRVKQIEQTIDAASEQIIKNNEILNNILTQLEKIPQPISEEERKSQMEDFYFARYGVREDPYEWEGEKLINFLKEREKRGWETCIADLPKNPIATTCDIP